MKLGKYLKIAIITIVALAVLMVISIATLFLFVNPNHYKPLIISTVRDTTDRTLNIGGKISWTIYPNIGLTIKDVTLSNPTGFKDTTPFAKINDLNISASLIPLITHKIIINHVNVDGLNLHLVKESGLNNWSFSQKSATASTNITKPNKQATIFISLKGMQLNHTTISYNNGQLHRELKDFSLNIDSGYGGGIKLDTSNTGEFDLNNVIINFNNWIIGKLNFKLNNFVSPVYNSDINFSKIDINSTLNAFDLYPNNLPHIDILSDLLIKANFKGNLQEIELNHFQASSPKKLDLSAKIKLNNFSNPNYTGSLTISEFALGNTLKQMGWLSESLANQAIFKQLHFQTKFIGTNGNLNIDELTIELPNIIKSVIHIKLANLFTTTTYTGHIEIPAFSLNNLMNKAGMNLPKFITANVLDNIKYQNDFNGTTKNATLTAINLAIGSYSELTGTVILDSFSPISIRETLGLNKMNIANFVDINGYQLILNNSKLTGDFQLHDFSGHQKLQINQISLLGIDLDKFVENLNANLDKINKDIGGIQQNLSGNIIQKAQGAINASKFLANSGSTFDNLKQQFSNATQHGPKNLKETTDLGKFTGNISMHNKVIDPSDLNLTGPQIIMNGNGSINFNNQQIKYKTQSHILNKNINPMFTQIMFDSTITGLITSPNASLDWNSITKQLITQLTHQSDIKKSQSPLNQQLQSQKNVSSVLNVVKGLFGH